MRERSAAICFDIDSSSAGLGGTAVAIELVRGHVEELAVWAVGDEAHAALLSALGGTTC